MEEKKILYEMILELWTLIKKYCFGVLDDDGWQAMTDEANALSNKYRGQNENIKRLFCDLYFAFERYKAARDKSEREGAA